eukprot:3293014-Pleurochrysis_carterae.AAC.1
MGALKPAVAASAQLVCARGCAPARSREVCSVGSLHRPTGGHARRYGEANRALTQGQIQSLHVCTAGS